jgi:outer membrane protein
MKIATLLSAAIPAMMATAPVMAAEAAPAAPEARAVQIVAAITSPAPASGIRLLKPKAQKPEAASSCPVEGCRYRLTADELLSEAEKLIAKKEYSKAKVLIAALGDAPGFELQHKFLTGFIALQTGDLKTAEAEFRSILQKDPSQTRVRLELARTLMLSGKETSADYHFRLAQNDKSVPPEIASTIRSLRGILRNQRQWHFDFNIGIAPDSNINSATSAETVNINFGPFQLPLSLSSDARAKSGIGQTGGFSGGIRFKMNDKIALLADADTRFVNYDGSLADDYQVQLAAGPELRIGKTTSASLQLLGDQRWYGGHRISRDYGARLNIQKILDEGQKIGGEIEVRKTNSVISDVYSGTQYGANITYERIVGSSFIASASLFGRIDRLGSAAYSGKNYGISLGIGGELPFGLNAGISGSVSRSTYDAAQPVYSLDPRADMRYFGRAYVGVRSLSVAGFSPSFEYTYSRNDSNYTLFQSKRHRANFKLSRYF